MLIAFASPRAPEQERDVLTTSADSLQPLRPHPPLASSPPKKRVVFAPHDNTGCPPPLPPHRRSVRDPKIPIGPAQPNRASSFPRFPPYEAFGRRPRAQSQRACKGPPSETLQYCRRSRPRPRTGQLGGKREFSRRRGRAGIRTKPAPDGAALPARPYGDGDAVQERNPRLGPSSQRRPQAARQKAPRASGRWANQSRCRGPGRS
jgi:hypothetical protein